MTKALIIVLDGLGDRPIAQFNGKTPLEHASTVFLDQLTRQGMCGLVDPLMPGMPVSTHTGMALLMGLMPKYVGSLSRGPVEAYGIDLAMQPSDIILRCNFAHLQDDGQGLKVLDRRAGRINTHTDILAQAVSNIKLKSGIKAKVYPTTQHRCVLQLSGDNLSAQVSDTDCLRKTPAYLQKSKAMIDNTNAINTAARNTAAVINEFSQQAHLILNKHPINEQRIKQGKVPANGVLCRSAGKIAEQNNILTHYKLKVAVIAGEATVIGLAKMFDFNALKCPEFTALVNTDLDKKIEQSLVAMEQHDLVYLHIKGTDICAHDHLAQLKTNFIEKIDKALSKISMDDAIIAITADHSTDSNTGFHTGDPVPSIIYSPYGRIDKSTRFSELECMSGGLGRLTSHSFLFSILDQMGCLHNFNNNDTKVL